MNEKQKFTLMFNEQEFVAICRISDYENGNMEMACFLYLKMSGKIQMTILLKPLVCF